MHGTGTVTAMDHELTLSLVLYFTGRAKFACDMAEKWKNGSWVARCIAFLCYSWFLYEPTAAVNVFGGIEQIKAMMETECVEKHFLNGHSALIRKNLASAISSFQNADLIMPDNPYIIVCLAVALAEQGQRREAQEISSKLKEGCPNHPLNYVFQFEDREAG